MKTVLFYLLTIACAHGQFSGERETPAESTAGTVSGLDELVSAAVSDPEKFCRTRRYKDLIALIRENPSARPAPADPGSPAAPAGGFVSSLVKFVRTLSSDKPAACAAGCDAASLAFRQLKDAGAGADLYGHLARLGCNAATDSLYYVNHYLKYDVPVERLLKVNYYSKHHDERKSYAERLEQALEKYGSTSRLTDLMHRIGDVYYSLKEFRRMRAWYVKVLERDPDRERNTPAGYRLGVAARHIRRQNLAFTVYGLYVVLALFLAFRIVRGGPCDARFCLKRAAVLSAVYLAVLVLILYVDGRIFHAKVKDIVGAPGTREFIVEPAVPLGFLQIDFTLLADAFATGLVPLLYVLAVLSLARPGSRTGLCCAAVVLACTLWTHFALRNIYSEFLETDGTFAGARFLFPGELEELLVESPEKVLKANPDLLNSDNTDLKLFLKEKYPDGLEK